MSGHCLLLRKDLRGPLEPPRWSPGVRQVVWTPDRLEPVHQLLTQAYRNGSGRIPDLDSWGEQLATDAEFDPTLCFIAEDAGAVVGVALGWVSAYIKDLVVAPQWQRAGLGRALLLQIFAAYKERGEPWVDLRVLENNWRARWLYQSVGMCVVLREPY